MENRGKGKMKTNQTDGGRNRRKGGGVPRQNQLSGVTPKKGGGPLIRKM